MRQMQQPMVGMPRGVPAGANMAAFNAASQAGMAGLNPGNIPMQRGAGGQSHPHQVLFIAPITLRYLLKKACDY
jgi:cyclin-dependent kinase 8/11